MMTGAAGALPDEIGKQVEASAAAAAASSGESAASQSPWKLFIGQVPKHVNEPELRKYFEKYGEISELVVLKDKHTNQHKGCAFCVYKTRESADRAINELHEKVMLYNRHLQVRFAGDKDQLREPKLFVGMLSKTTGEDQVRALFAPYGSVKEVHLMKDQQQNSKGAAFVKMNSKEEADAAIRALHDQYQDSGSPNKLVVRFAEHKAPQNRGMMQMGMGRGGGGNMYGVNPYGGFQPAFGGFGRGGGGYGGGMMMNNPMGQLGQLGGAASAPVGMQGASFNSFQQAPSFNTFPDTSLYQQQAFPGGGRGAGGSFGGGAGGAPGEPREPRGPAGANLFVYNVPESFTDGDLASMFSNFGSVLSAKVFKDRTTGVPKGFGFVSYDNSGSAEKAISGLNGFMIGSKRLKVQLKTPGSSGGGGAVGGGGGAGRGYQPY
jgi:RNA recognition motif-containing protein